MQREQQARDAETPLGASVVRAQPPAQRRQHDQRKRPDRQSREGDRERAARHEREAREDRRRADRQLRERDERDGAAGSRLAQARFSATRSNAIPAANANSAIKRNSSSL